MPKFSPDPVVSGPTIRGFVENGFRIDLDVYSDGALLTPESAVQWVAPTVDQLDVAALGGLLDRDPVPEFLLLGTGSALRRPLAAFMQAVEARGLGIELMDSRAAARAWGVLRAEGREIVAALLPTNR
jgi:uncharacterized protein